jgi:hypothetical protein
MEATAAFDLYYLIVENIAGNVYVAGLLLMILFAVMGIVTRMSPTTLITLLGFFIGVYSIGLFGELVLVPIFIFSFMYFVIGLGRFLMRRLEAY